MGCAEPRVVGDFDNFHEFVFAEAMGSADDQAGFVLEWLEVVVVEFIPVAVTFLDDVFSVGLLALDVSINAAGESVKRGEHNVTGIGEVRYL